MSKRIAFRLLALTGSLGLVWVTSGALAYGLALLVGSARSAVAAFAAPPLALGLLFALRALLRAVLRRVEPRLGEAAARREAEALMADPDFIESLAQMARGEGRPARTREEKDQDR